MLLRNIATTANASKPPRACLPSRKCPPPGTSHPKRTGGSHFDTGISGVARGLAAGVIGFVAISFYDTKPALRLAKSRFILEGLKRVIDDRAVAGAIDELPHAKWNGALAPDEMG